VLAVYSTCNEDRNVKESQFVQYMNGIIDFPGLKEGILCTLKVIVPSQPSDQFWSKTYGQFHWDGTKGDEGLSFMVKAWGPDANYATFYATRIAEDFIKTVRNRLDNNLIQPVTHHILTQRRATMCPVLHLGADLNKSWRHSSPYFSLSGLTTERGLATNARSIISDLEKQFSYPFLRYYLVPRLDFPEVLTVDFSTDDFRGI
jgi:hypothetical protein